MKRAVFGTTGGPQYRLLHQPDWGRLPDNSRILAAHAQGQLVGVVALSEETWGLLAILLAVAPNRQGEGIGKLLLREAQAIAASEGKCIAGTIETAHQRSLHVALSSNFRRVARLSSRTFTRIRPRNRQARRGTPADLPQIQRSLSEQGQHWFSQEHVLPNECWVTKEMDAGLQLMKQHWQLVALGGLPRSVDRLTLRCMPLIGIHPTDFVFATAHNWWGDPAKWAQLMEHALWAEGLQAIIVTGDQESPVWQTMERQTWMGMVGSAVGSNSMEVASSGSFPSPLAFTPMNAL